MIKSKKQMFIVIAIFAFIMIILGTTYAWFNYKREGVEQRLIAGNIYLNFNENNDGISLTNVFPETEEEARSRNDNYLTSECGARPTLHLKSTVKILSGTGTETDPYVVGL